MKWSWYYVAQYIIEPVYGGYVDWEEEFFECPKCGELIYKCDYPYIDIGMIFPYIIKEDWIIFELLEE